MPDTPIDDSVSQDVTNGEGETPKGSGIENASSTEEAFNEAASELYDSIIAAIDGITHDIMSVEDEVYTSLAGDISSIDAGIDNSTLDAERAIAKEAKAVELAVEQTYTSLLDLGVNTPVNQYTVNEQLNDATGQLLVQAFTEPFIAPTDDLPPEPQRYCVELATGKTDPADWDGMQWTCPVGWVLAAISFPPPPPPPPIPPPPVPPPPVPPPLPPPPPPSEPSECLPVDSSCASFVGPSPVVYNPREGLEKVWWYAVCHPETCTIDLYHIICDKEPDTSSLPAGALLVWTHQAEVYYDVGAAKYVLEHNRAAEYARAVCSGRGVVVPPTSPPSPPTTPTVPPIPPTSPPPPPPPVDVAPVEIPTVEIPTLWGNVDDCSKVETWIAEHAAISGTTGEGVTSVLAWTASLLDNTGAGIIHTGTKLLIKDIINAIPGVSGVGDDWKFQLSEYIPFDAIERYIDGTITTFGVPNQKPANSLGQLLMLASWGESITGFPFKYLASGVQYSFQYANPQFIPSQAEIDGMYLVGLINDDLWNCYTRANGNIPAVYAKEVKAKEYKPDQLSVVSLFRRGVIPTIEEYRDRQRHLGILDAKYSDELLKLTEQLPGISDQIRFMVRDVHDERVYKKFKYDDGFTEKYNDEAKRLSRASGIPEELFILYWRAHWNIPSATQLYEILHRLRPDRPEVDEWIQANPDIDINTQAARDAGAPLVVTVADVKYALQVDDMAPGWVDAMVNVSYRPITNTDASRMFEIGTYDSRSMYHAFRSTGYNVKEAQDLVRFYEAQKSKRISNVSGVLTVRKIVRAFRDGAIGKDEAETLLAPIIHDSQTRGRILDGVELELRIESFTVRLKGLRKRFLYGELDQFQLEKEPAALNIPVGRRQNLVDLYNADRYGHRKEPRVQFICGWFKNGIITQQEYYVRLTQLGYSMEDSDRILKTCLAEHQAKQAREAAIAAEKHRKEQERVARGVLKKLEEGIKEAEKRLKELEKQIEQQQGEQE